METDELWDVFISYASEDKGFVNDLAVALEKRGLRVWYDAFEMQTGDSVYELLQDLLRSQNFKSVPFFDRPSVIRFLDELPAMDDRTRTSMDPVLFMMASIGVLHEHHRL